MTRLLLANRHLAPNCQEWGDLPRNSLMFVRQPPFVVRRRDRTTLRSHPTLRVAHLGLGLRGCTLWDQLRDHLYRIGLHVVP